MNDICRVVVVVRIQKQCVDRRKAVLKVEVKAVESLFSTGGPEKEREGCQLLILVHREG
jgi:hypothetical protein